MSQVACRKPESCADTDANCGTCARRTAAGVVRLSGHHIGQATLRGLLKGLYPDPYCRGKIGTLFLEACAIPC